MGAAPQRGGSKGGGLKAGGPKFRAFFPSPAPVFALCLSLSVETPAAFAAAGVREDPQREKKSENGGAAELKTGGRSGGGGSRAGGPGRGVPGRGSGGGGSGGGGQRQGGPRQGVWERGGPGPALGGSTLGGRK